MGLKIFKCLQHLTSAWRNLREFDKAIDFGRKALKMAQDPRQFSPEQCALAYNNLGNVWYSSGNYNQAIYAHLNALAIRERNGADESLAQTFHNLGTIYQNTKDWQQSADYLQRACDLFGKTLGTNHPRYATSLINLARTKEKLGLCFEVVTLIRQGYEIRLDRYGEDHEFVANCRELLVRRMNDCGFWQEALVEIQSQSARKKARFGDNYPQRWREEYLLLQTYRSLKNYELAVPLGRKLVNQFLADQNLSNSFRFRVLNQTGFVLAEAGYYQEAEHILQQRLALVEKGVSPNHPRVVLNKANLGWLAGLSGQFDKAEAKYLNYFAYQEKVGKPSVVLSFFKLHYGKMLVAQGRREEALDAFQEAARVYAEAATKNHYRYGEIIHEIGLLLEAKGSRSEAGKHLEEAYKIRKRVLPEGHPHILQSARALESINQKPAVSLD